MFEKSSSGALTVLKREDHPVSPFFQIDHLCINKDEIYVFGSYCVNPNGKVMKNHRMLFKKIFCLFRRLVN